MKAIILAGGEGVRLRPITSDLPKPLVPIMGVPLLRRIVMLLKEHDITQIGIASCYMAEKIEQTIGNGEDMGVQITYFHEKVPMGTAGAVKQAERFLSDTFLVIAGDCLTDANITEAVSFHKEKNSMATLILKRVDVPLQYGVVVTDSTGSIVRFLEKPSWKEVFADTVNTGIYILNKDVLSRVKNDEPTDFSKDLFPKLLSEKCPMFGYEMQGYWCDVGDVDVYRKSHFDLFDRRLAMKESFDAMTVEEGVMIEDGAEITPPVRIGRDTRIESGAKIGKYAVIGRGCCVRSGASVSRSVLMDGVLLEKGASVRGSVLCDRAVVKQDATVFEQTVIGEASRVGRNAIVCPGVRVFPYKDVSEGTRLTDHLIWGANKNPSQIVGGSVSGAWGYEITTALAESFGASLGGKGHGLAVACSEDPAAESLKQAFCAGALANGAIVYDLGSGTAPLVSSAVRAKHLLGGVWFGVGDHQAEMIFLGKNGACLSGQDAKETEPGRRGKKLPMPCVKVGRPMDCAAYRREYIEGLLHICPTKNAQLSLTLRGGNETVMSCAKATLSRMGCHVAEGMNMDTKNALSAYLSADGRELLLYDDRNMPIFGERLRALFYLLLTKCKEQSVIRISKTVPDGVVRMIEKTGMKTELLEEEKTEEVLCMSLDADARRQRTVFYDAVGALCMLVDVMATCKMTLKELLEEIPVFYVVSEEIPCAETKKATMLTYLRSVFDQKGAEGGIRVKNERGKAYLYPDAQREVFHMAAESTKEEYARELAALCKNVFNKIQ